MAHETQSRIDFTNSEGQKLAGILKESNTKAAVILCHGLGSHKNGFHLPAIANGLAAKGISSFRFDMPGCADSEGDFKYANIKEEADCIESARQLLESKGYLVVGLLGHSKSGSGVLVHSSRHGSKIPKVVVCAGRFNHKRGIKERFGDDVFEKVEEEGYIPQQFEASWGLKEWRFDKKDLEDRMSLDMLAECKAISPNVDILLIHGTEDATIPYEDASAFQDLLPKSKLVIIDGADHGFKNKQEYGQQVINEAVSFFAPS